MFKAQKTMYGGKRIAKGDTIFIFASENKGGPGLVATGAKRAKIILAGKVEKAFQVSGIAASKGAKAAIESAGGSVAAIEAIVRPAKLAAKKPAEKAAAR